MPRLIEELESSRSAKLNAQLRDRRFTTRRKFTRVFIVWSDTCDQDEVAISATPGLPTLYSTIYGVRLIDISYDEIEPFYNNGVLANIWHVTCKYDSERDTPEEGEEDLPPEARTPHIRWYGTQETWIPENDITGTKITNSSGQFYEPEIERILPVLEIKRYELSPFNPETILGYVNSVNGTPFWGAPIGTALMLPIESERVVVDSVIRENVTYKIKFRPEPKIIPAVIDPDCSGAGDVPAQIVFGEWEENTWDYNPIDQGDATFVPTPSSGVGDARNDRFVDINGNLINVLLDGKGEKLEYYNCPDVQPPRQLPPVRRGPFKLRWRTNFNLLSLGPF